MSMRVFSEDSFKSLAQKLRDFFVTKEEVSAIRGKKLVTKEALQQVLLNIKAGYALKSEVPDAVSGPSAYDEAVKNGYKGTEKEWIASLKGAKGDTGDSAYTIAIKHGYSGTEANWLASLKGATGPQGPKGEKGDAQPMYSIDEKLKEKVNASMWSATLSPETIVTLMAWRREERRGNAAGFKNLFGLSYTSPYDMAKVKLGFTGAQKEFTDIADEFLQEQELCYQIMSAQKTAETAKAQAQNNQIKIQANQTAVSEAKQKAENAQAKANSVDTAVAQANKEIASAKTTINSIQTAVSTLQSFANTKTILNVMYQKMTTLGFASNLKATDTQKMDTFISLLIRYSIDKNSILSDLKNQYSFKGTQEDVDNILGSDAVFIESIKVIVHDKILEASSPYKKAAAKGFNKSAIDAWLTAEASWAMGRNTDLKISGVEDLETIAKANGVAQADIDALNKIIEEDPSEAYLSAYVLFIQSEINKHNQMIEKLGKGIEGPQGPRGVQGKAASIKIGSVALGKDISVTNSGTEQDAILNFVIPSGNDLRGPGPKGDKGDKGDSAYTVAKSNGYTGTEKDWVNDTTAKDIADADIDKLLNTLPAASTAALAKVSK